MMGKQKHNLQAEEALLGCAIVGGNQTVDNLIELGVKDYWFYSGINAAIWRAIEQVANSGEPLDEISLGEQLKKDRTYDTVGGNPFLVRISNLHDTAVQYKKYAFIVSNYYYKRRIRGMSDKIVELSEEEGVDYDHILDEISSEYDHIQSERHQLNGPGFVSAREATGEAVESLNDLIRTRGQSGRGIMSGLRSLDKITQGFRNGEIVVIAARPGCGKTSLAMQIAANAAINDHHVLFFSLEMSARQLMERTIASLAMVDMGRIRDGFPTHDVNEDLKEAAAKCANMNMQISDTPGESAKRIRARCKQLKRANRLDMVFVDYIQLVGPSSRSIPREQQVAEIMSDMVAIKKECNVPVVLLAQINRQAEADNRAPRMSDLRESGSIEQDADVILFQYKDLQTKNEEPIEDRVWFKIEKSRNGPTGLTPMHFEKKYTRFLEYEQ